MPAAKRTIAAATGITGAAHSRSAEANPLEVARCGEAAADFKRLWT